MTVEKFIEFVLSKGLSIGYCVAIIFIGMILSKISKKFVFSFFNSKISNTRMMDERKSQTLASIVSSIIRYIIYFVCICAILNIFGIDVSSLIAVASVGSVVIGLGAQSIVKDIFAGFFIILEDQFGVGDIVTIEGHTGTVEAISTRTTQIRAFDGTVHIIPNGSITIVTNLCKEYMCAIVNVDVSYGTDVKMALDVLANEMEKCYKTITALKEVPRVLGVVALGDSGITLRVIAECEIKENFRIERELRLKIKERFDKEGISIPFPQRTLHIVKSEE